MGASGGRTALGIAGFAVGAYFGNPGLGLMAGSLLGNLVFPPEGQNIETSGPQLNDLSVSASSYGMPFPIGYGVIGVGGNVIWSTDLIENEKVSEVETGGKGGGASSTQTNTTYFYTASFAVSFGEGPADDVLRLWMNGNLVYDKTGASDITVVEGGINFRFYPGNATQLPDPLIEEDRGEGRTPAFRDQVYIVFDNLDLTTFGNRLPNIIAEIAYNSAPVFGAVNLDFITTGEGGLFDGLSGTLLSADLDVGRGFFLDITGSPQGIRRYNLFTFEEDGQRDETEVSSNFTAFDTLFLFTTTEGDVICQMNNGSRNFYQPIVKVDGNSLQSVAEMGTLTNTGPITPDTKIPTFDSMMNLVLYGLQGKEEFVIGFATFQTHLVVLKVGGSAFTYISDTTQVPGLPGSGYQFRGHVRGAAGEGVGTAYFIMEPTGTPPYSGDVKLFRLTLRIGAGQFGPVYNTVIDEVGSYSPSTLTQGTSSTLYDSGGILVYDRVDGNVIFYVNKDNASFSHTYIHKIDVSDGSILWTANPQDRGPSIYSYGGMSRVEGTMGFVFDFDEWHLLNTLTGEFYEDSPNLGGSGSDIYSIAPSTSGQGFFDSKSQTWTGFASSGLFGRWFLNRGAGADEDLGVIVRDICERSNIAAADIDESALTGTLVPGYVISRQMTGRQAIQPLARLYQFDGVETGFKLVFVKRGGASVRTIQQADLVTVDEQTGEYLREQRTQEIELPLEFSIVFKDRDNAYENNTAYFKRIQSPVRSMDSDNKQGFSIAGSYRMEAMKRACERLLFTAWNERQSIEVQLPWTHVDLDPADVVTVVLDDGTTYRSRLSELNLGANLAVEATGINEEEGQYTDSTASAYGGDGGPVQKIRQEIAAKLILFDSPLLRDTHEPASRAYNVNYFFMGGYAEDQFTRGIVYQSSDGISFDEIGTAIRGMTWGSVTTVLPDPVAGLEWHTDNSTVVEVVTVAGAANFVSVTQLQMLNGANGLAILKANGEMEIIQFRDVTQLETNRFQLSGLLRGRRGTDTMSYSHTAGEKFVLLQSGVGSTFPLTLSQKDTALTYRGVPSGKAFEEVGNDSLTSTHRALKPYAVCQTTATIDGSNNIDLAWVRRTRVGGIGWIDGTGTVPLSEDTEEYEIDIYDSPGGSIVRSVTGLSSPAYQYTAANQSTDGFSPPLTQLTVMIYQISAQVDRGFARELTLEIK